VLGSLLDGVQVGGDVVGSLVAHPVLPSVCGLQQHATATSSPGLLLQCIEFDFELVHSTIKPFSFIDRALQLFATSNKAISGKEIVSCIAISFVFSILSNELPVSGSPHQGCQTLGSAPAPPQNLHLSTHGKQLLLPGRHDHLQITEKHQANARCCFYSSQGDT